MASSVSMPIKEVFLYDNGYAVFHREAEITGEGHINLFFHSNHVKSVLESLRFYGDAGNKIGNIAYEATKPKANFRISSVSPYQSLIQQMVGNDVTLQVVKRDGTGEEEISGRVLGIDDLFDGASKESVSHAIVFIDSTKVVSIPLHCLTGVKLTNERKKHDIKHALDLSTTSEEDQTQKLCVFYSDVPGTKSVQCQYGLEVAEWQSSYRLVFTTETLTAFELDGMAIVENTLDEDWTNVQLTLIVGAPALHASKSAVESGLWQLTIKHFLGGEYFTIRCNVKDSVMSLKMKINKKKKIDIARFNLVFAGKELDDGRLVSDYTIRDRSTLHMEPKKATQKGGGVGEMSQGEFVMSSQDSLSYYPIKSRVTAQRKQKAVVPLLQAKMTSQRIVLYDETVFTGNPLAAILFENTTGRILDGGKIQIYHGTRFLGNSDLPCLHPGDECPPIPYAVKMGCEVNKTIATKYLDWHAVDVIEGEIRLIRKRHEITTYAIRNKTEDELDFLLNHLFLENYDLVREDLMDEIGEPVDITDKVYQFRFIVEPKDQKKKFLITEECEDLRKTALCSITHRDIQEYEDKKWLNKETIQVLREIANDSKEMNSLTNAVYEKEKEIREIKDRQQDLRDNIKTVENSKVDAAKYIKALSVGEDRMHTLQQAIKTSREKKTAISKKQGQLISDLKYNAKLN